MGGPDAKWWGWGLATRRESLDERPDLVAYLDRRLGLRAGRLPPRVEDVSIPASRLDGGALEALATVVGEDHVRADVESRVRRAVGRSYRDLVALRSGRLDRAPDAVVAPPDEAAIASVLSLAAARGFTVVPFGGGTSVVGGVEPGDDPRPAIALDLGRLARLLSLDDASLTATAEAGIRGPALEAVLRPAGYTLGHFPQSFEFSTLGGWVATRSTGGLSNRYGRIEDLVVSLRLVHPGGVLETLRVPATAAGPSLKEIVLGSEGVLGVVTRATVRVRRAPAALGWATFFFRSFRHGLDALRSMAQSGPLPAMTYLSDEAETEMGGTMGAPPLLSVAGVLKRLGGKKPRTGSLLNLSFEGTPEEVEAQKRCARAACGKGTWIGAAPARRFTTLRYETPYLRDAMLDRGLLVETVETATSWSVLPGLYHGARDALARALESEGTPGLVLCHASHVYPDGASLYFTFLQSQKQDDEIGQWRRLKRAVTDAIVENGGTVTHHHGVGLDHRPWVAREWGESGLAALRALKSRLDPSNVMNPGKLLS